MEKEAAFDSTLTGILTYTTGTLAQAEPLEQQSVKLASVGTSFPTGAIKGAYGSEYTGNFTPLNKKDEKIV
ncbi:hypothetical protein [Treponema primitia]|uniref:hypothetical protein n=1 Tax=Treponema primitia TaxID=88058 RepID=UPI0011D1B334|nr:hypothetical protein [Treponema primitia]